MTPGIRWLLYCLCGLAGSVTADAVAAPAGWPCNPCSAEDIRRLGIVAPPPKVRPACDAYDNDKTDVARWINRPANCAD